MRSSASSFICIALLLLAATPARADDCALPSQGGARIAAVIDARTLLLDDGSEIRIAGLAALPPDHAARATVALRRLIGHAVTLHGDSDAPDRYGRQSLLVRRDGAAQSLQADLLAQGDALSDLTLSACAKTFGIAEAEARRTRAGLWSDRSVIKNAESPDDISAGIGRFGIVEGRVLSVRQSGTVTYVNFGRRWTRDFAVTIPKRLLSSFEAAGLMPKALEGKWLRVRGFIEHRGPNGGPRIEAIRPEQIEIAGATSIAGASE